MCLTAHFIDQDWNLRKKIINFGELKGHKGAAERFEKVFMMFDMYDDHFRKDLESKKDRHGIIGVPEKDDWENARRMMGFLGRFYDFTLKISGSKYTTSNLFLQEVHSLYHLITKWETEVEKDLDLSIMASKMKMKYEKYWGDVDKMNKLLYISTIMDPRYKMGFVDFALKMVYPEGGKGARIAENVRKATFDLFAHYEQLWKLKQSKNASTSLAPIVEEGDGDELDVLAEYKKHREQIVGAVNKSGLEKYLHWIRGDSAPPSAEEDPQEVEKIDEELDKLMNAISIRDNLVSSTSTSNVPSSSGRRNDGSASSSAWGENSDVSMHD
ncbi:unnamed protein product [Linum trigynum]|uniref:hAT-like transposase RNase-H fold domain-containing protein n=1 Tax=Linum trigynum TaxID=586398 RepID=A0AAV2E0Q7_9ROSI